MSRWTRNHTLILVLLAACGAVLTLIFCRFTIDDAFITWRYGETLVRHGAWTWDAWAPLVEAYTNPIYAFASIIPAATGLPAELFFKLVSVAVAALLAWWVLTRRAVSRLQRLVVLAVTFAVPAFHVHLWSGLETALFVAATVVFGSLALDGRLGGSGTAAIVVLILARPEGLVLAGLAALWRLLLGRDRRALIIAVAVWAAELVYWAARALYFGRFFPNTFYVKSGGGTPEMVFFSVAFSLGIFVSVAGLAVLLALGLRSVRETALPRLRRDDGTFAQLAWLTPLVLALGSAVITMLLNRSSNLLMNYANRFEWQLVLPVALVALLTPLTRRGILAQAAAVIVSIAAMASATERLVESWLLLAVAGMAAVLAWSLRRPSAMLAAGIALVLSASFVSMSELLSLATYRSRLADAHQAIALVLRDSEVRNRSVTVGDAGVLPFIADWHAIDVYGLASTEVVEGRLTPETLAANPPAVIIQTSSTPSQTTSTSVPGMATTLAFALDPSNGYTHLGGVTWRDGYYLQLYVSPDVDSGTRNDLRAVVQASSVNARNDADYFATHLKDLPFLNWVTG